MNVTLDWPELELAAAVGLRRQVASLQAGRQDRHGFTGDGWGIHVEGACGEMAVAKCLGRFWNGSVDSFKAPDLPGSLQVRTRSRHDFDLIVRSDDRDSDVFVLVTGRAPEFIVHGWIKGHEAKQQRWVRTYGDRPAAFFVPQAALKRLG